MIPLRQKHTRHVPDTTLPLINIVLLLVLAFMIAGVIETPLPAEFEPVQANSETGSSSETAPLSLVITQTGEVLIDSEQVKVSDLHELFKMSSEQEMHLSIKADSRAPAADVIGVLAKAEDAGIKKAVVMTIGADK